MIIILKLIFKHRLGAFFKNTFELKCLFMMGNNSWRLESQLVMMTVK